ncbi:MAG: DNA repair protein RecN [Alphaproteobacteria bacterium ADurb.Bin438]|nr:MAG: DNA repair protein RecN [Alphaproteobacteria bacterium ADurb.Bin438]
MVRVGEKQLQVVATFDLSEDNKVFEVLKELEIETENNQVILKRIVTAEGKSKAFVNDVPVTLNAIKRLNEFLVEIHGQFGTHGLLDNKTHIHVLDEFGGYDLSKLKSSYNEYIALNKEYERSVNELEKLKLDEEYLKHNLDELLAFKIGENEYQELSEKVALASNYEKIFKSLSSAFENLNSQDICGALRNAKSSFDKIYDVTNGKYQPYCDILERVEIEIKELINDVESEVYNQDVNPNQLDSMQERLFAFKSLAKKHRVLPEELHNLIDELKSKIAKIDYGYDNIILIKQKLEKARLNYLENARDINKKRIEAGIELDKAVMSELPALKLGNAKFKTEVMNCEDFKDNGMNTVKFKVITNAGGDFEELSKIASGGELARFMLALKVNLSNGAESLVFDEVDSGIGGATASAVGQRLQRLGVKKQVLVVTHSPQVASFGSSHFMVKKYEKEGKTFTTVNKLDDDLRIKEIARMLAGETITTASIEAAKQLVSDNERA